MGFFAQTRDRLALRSKQNAFRKRPSAELLGDLVKCQLRLGDYEAAHRYTVWGRRLFPDSPVVDQMYRIAARARAEKGMQDARRDVKAKPTPGGFQRLAQYAIEISDGVTAMAALRECIQRFPTCAPAYTSLADLCERRYLRDLSRVDGREVLQLYQKACKLDAKDQQAPLRLAQFYVKIGALEKGRSTVEEVLQRDRQCEEAHVLLQRIAASDGSEDDVEDLLRQIEEEGRLPGNDQDTRRMRREVSRLCRGLKGAQEELGANRILVVDADGQPWDDQGPVASDAFVGLLANLSSSAQMTTRRVGLGPLRGVTLESGAGSIVVRRGTRALVGASLKPDESILGSQERLSELIGGQLAEQKQS